MLNSRKKRRGARHKGIRPFMPLPGMKSGRSRRDDGASGVMAMDNHGNVQNDFVVASEEQPDPVELAAGGPAVDIDELIKERDSYLDMARRERADFDNYRKRMQREMALIERRSLASFLKDFFGPLDDLDRVLQESVKNQSFESLVTGVRIMEKKFWESLAKAGVRKIDAKGKPFDPEQHEAMTTIPSADVPPNTVLEVFENGYKLDDFVLRPARVVVSREP